MKNKLLFFETMITPKLITFIYWLMLLGAVFYGLSHMFGGYKGFTFSKFIMGLVFIAGGALLARIWCELLIVIFKINENLHNQKKDD